MAYKIVTLVIMVILVVVAGVGGYFTYSLNQQLQTVEEQAQADRQAQAERLDDLEAQGLAQADEFAQELAGLRTDTLDSLASLGEDIDTLNDGLEQTGALIAGARADIAMVNTQLGALDERVSQAESTVAATTFNASQVYQAVSQATVCITDGENTVGTGFIFDDFGRVLTAAHVADAVSRIYAVLSDGSSYRAYVIGSDRSSDVAVLELATIPSIEPAALGDSSLTGIGDPVAAIGSPFGLHDTLTTGIISQVNRYTVYGDDFAVSNLFQFDTPVNPGNSGGPLINARGEVIGIVVARIVPTEGDGIGYAVTSNKARRVAEAILETGRFDYPWVGVNITDLTPELVLDLSLDSTHGVLVSRVVPGSPAESAGFRLFDVIVSVDGRPVKDSGEFTSYQGEFLSPGDTVVIEVIRDGQLIEITVTIGIRPS